eukprot:CAMPEP_0177160316 /NCGR_PEP_ID=MMETSP0367-20130122/4763_1 /TAXON_ID=447022 ORGANISM="Scrippsiella hangoei-like, Strain SHHI-4" /NCGR_SAMPLE_ID=MMETSP0367 /ASSEMBLY_ACC=CAM_ASM_000362 /LENGTH=182 /DNA_ID=CAMNT_0018605965 /DNA_START=243 /DNA_END=788 /DNA_ORIENTATION=+
MAVKISRGAEDVTTPRPKQSKRSPAYMAHVFEDAACLQRRRLRRHDPRRQRASGGDECCAGQHHKRPCDEVQEVTDNWHASADHAKHDCGLGREQNLAPCADLAFLRVLDDLLHRRADVDDVVIRNCSHQSGAPQRLLSTCPFSRARGSHPSLGRARRVDKGDDAPIRRDGRQQQNDASPHV